MPKSQTCSECGRPLAGSDASNGFCPACMLEGALRIGSDPGPDLPSPASRKRFGDYELLEEIARGGMGVVFRARQVSLDRIVAVKLILFGPYADEASVRRFRAEAAAAAQLRHPNIVAIHEVGEEAGQPFFSMDCVQGRNLADYAREHPPTARQAARLLQIIAEAIHYAHREGILHRDLKPSNILIEATGEPRITDFGLAKRFDNAEAGAGNDLTLSGQILGSPSYVSPEQASGRRGQAGPQTDLYALGAILYFLLTGRPPFAAETITDTLHQVLNEDPVSPRRLNPSLPRDLEIICLKCLEKDPLKRYRSAQELADELGRFLRTEPIHAHPVSPLEKFSRWCRRQPALATALALLLVVAIGSPIAAIRINRERREAEAARKQAEANEKIAASEAAKSGQVARFLQDMLMGVGPYAARGRDTTMLREVLDQTAARLKGDLAGQPEVEAALRGTLGNVYNQLGDYTNAAAMFREALRLRRTLHGDEDPDIAQWLYELAWVVNVQADWAEAEALSREALRLRKKLFGNKHRLVAVTLMQLGAILRAEFKYAEAERLGQEALAMLRKLLGDEDPAVADTLSDLSMVFQAEGRYPEAEAADREAYAIMKKMHPTAHPDLMMAMETHGMALESQGKYDEAEAIFREGLVMAQKLYGREHPEVAKALANAGRELSRRGQLTESEAMLRESLAIRRKLLGNEHPSLVSSLGPLAQVLSRQGNFAESEALFRECLAIREKKFPDAWQTPETRGELGACLLELHRFAEAEPLLLSAYEGLKQHREPLPPYYKAAVNYTLQHLVALYESTEQPAKADEWRKRLAQTDPH